MIYKCYELIKNHNYLIFISIIYVEYSIFKLHNRKLITYKRSNKKAETVIIVCSNRQTEDENVSFNINVESSS